jgi:hypothetical protein
MRTKTIPSARWAAPWPTFHPAHSMPLCTFLRPGTYTIKFYPDRDSSGCARVFRRVSVHHALPLNTKRNITCWRDERVDALVDEVTLAGMPQIFRRSAWQCRSIDIGVAAAHIFESTDEPAHPVGSSMILLFNRQQMYSIYNYLLTLSPQLIKEFLNPHIPGKGIIMKIINARRSHTVPASESLSLPMPPRITSLSRTSALPFTTLDDVYVTANQTLEENDWCDFQKSVYSQLKRWKAGKPHLITRRRVRKGDTLTNFKFPDKAEDDPRF